MLILCAISVFLTFPVVKLDNGIIRERVNSGLAAAKARGVRWGPRPATLEKRAGEVMALKKRGLGAAEEVDSEPKNVVWTGVFMQTCVIMLLQFYT